MEQRRTVNTDTDNVKTITIIDGQDVSDMGQIIFPIICEGDVIGSVVLNSLLKGNVNTTLSAGELSKRH